jgi:flagellar protein FliL
MTDQQRIPNAKPRRRKMILAACFALVACGGGAAGVVLASQNFVGKPVEDPRRPKLVPRSAEAETVIESGADKEAASKRRVGTVAVESDTIRVDPRKFELAYYPIGESFTANLADGSGFIQIGLSASTFYDSRIADNLSRQSVAIRSAILLVLSDQHAAELSTPEGKQKLQRVLARAINQVLRDREGFGGIDNVYFTSLIVQ